jgi:DNA-binding response OmpR family regulator
LCPKKRQENPKKTLIVTLAGLPELQSILEAMDWTVHAVSNLREALLFLCGDRVPIIITETKFPNGDWKDILSYTSEMTSVPTVVVTSHLTDEQLHAEAIILGASAVLTQPFRREEVAYAFDAALRRLRQQDQLRPALLYRTA